MQQAVQGEAIFAIAVAELSPQTLAPVCHPIRPRLLRTLCPHPRFVQSGGALGCWC